MLHWHSCQRTEISLSYTKITQTKAEIKNKAKYNC